MMSRRWLIVFLLLAVLTAAVYSGVLYLQWREHQRNESYREETVHFFREWRRFMFGPDAP